MKFNLTYNTRRWIHLALLILGFPMALIFGIIFGLNGGAMEMFKTLFFVMLFYVPYTLAMTFMLFTKEEIVKDIQSVRDAVKVYNEAVKQVPTTATTKQTKKTITKTIVNGVETITETITEEDAPVLQAVAPKKGVHVIWWIFWLLVFFPALIVVAVVHFNKLR
jgi:hypothetical protein